MPRVLIGVTGSVAAVKVPEIVDRLQSIQSPQVISRGVLKLSLCRSKFK